MSGFSDLVGKTPDVDALIAEWGSDGESEEGDEEVEGEEGEEGSEETEEEPIEEMVNRLRKRVYENKIRNLAKNR